MQLLALNSVRLKGNRSLRRAADREHPPTKNKEEEGEGKTIVIVAIEEYSNLCREFISISNLIRNSFSTIPPRVRFRAPYLSK